MELLRLVAPDISYAEQIRAYRREFLDDGGSMDGCGSLRRMENPLEWLEQVAALAREETVPENWVPSTQFLCIRSSDQHLVGMIQIRHRFNAFLEKFGGHIGYSVRPPERRKGYATKMLGDCLPHCRMLGLQSVLVTCLEDNVASRKIILANGGVYESTAFEPEEKVHLQRYWIAL